MNPNERIEVTFRMTRFEAICAARACDAQKDDNYNEGLPGAAAIFKHAAFSADSTTIGEVSHG